MKPSNPCPICERPVPGEGSAAAFAPFCSERCRNVDLYRWSRGKYAIVEPLDPERLMEESGRDMEGYD